MTTKSYQNSHSKPNVSGKQEVAGESWKRANTITKNVQHSSTSFKARPMPNFRKAHSKAQMAPKRKSTAPSLPCFPSVSDAKLLSVPLAELSVTDVEPSSSSAGSVDSCFDSARSDDNRARQEDQKAPSWSILGLFGTTAEKEAPQTVPAFTSPVDVDLEERSYQERVGVTEPTEQGTARVIYPDYIADDEASGKSSVVAARRGHIASNRKAFGEKQPSARQLSPSEKSRATSFKARPVPRSTYDYQSPQRRSQRQAEGDAHSVGSSKQKSPAAAPATIDDTPPIRIFRRATTPTEKEQQDEQAESPERFKGRVVPKFTFEYGPPVSAGERISAPSGDVAISSDSHEEETAGTLKHDIHTNIFVDESRCTTLHPSSASVLAASTYDPNGCYFDDNNKTEKEAGCFCRFW